MALPGGVQTTSTAMSAAITFKVKREVLRNLRNDLVFADPAYSDNGEYDAGHDVLTFIASPDLPINVTPLTEGQSPNKRALTFTTVTVAAAQYGDLVAVTDLLKVKTPVDVVAIAGERLGRQARESLDQIARDAIALGGTPAYAAGAASRVALAAGNLMTAAELRKLNVKMKKQKIPPFSDRFYRLWIHPNVEFDLRNDTAVGGFIDVNKYAQPDTILRGEVGRMEGFRIMTVLNAPTFVSTVTVYASIAVGNIKGWGTGSLQTLRTYHVPAGGDHVDPLAQEELLGWKVAWGVGILNNAYFMRFESAATNV